MNEYFGLRPTTTRGIPNLPTPGREGVGLGDIVAGVAKATGIARLTKGRDCGCNGRRRKLNRMRITRRGIKVE